MDSEEIAKFITEQFHDFINHRYNSSVNILINFKKYSYTEEKRFLIPFSTTKIINGKEIPKIGLIRHRSILSPHNFTIIAEPQFDFVIGDCYSENDILIVGNVAPHFWFFDDRNPKDIQYSYKAYNGTGSCIASNFHSYKLSTDNKYITIEKEGFNVVRNLGGLILPPNHNYSWIDGFHKGFARVKKKDRITYGKNDSEAKWGIINGEGELILPLEYDEILSFYDKDCDSITVVKDGEKEKISFEELKKLPPIFNGKRQRTREQMNLHEKPPFSPYYGEGQHRYDDSISDAFDGDPSAYWNID